MSSSMLSLAFAKDFIDNRTGDIFSYSFTMVERLGRALRKPVGTLLDMGLRHIRNPVVIVALTALAMLVATIAFYPVVAYNIIATVFPLILQIKPWMLQLAAYIAIQGTVLGAGLRL